MRLLFLNHNTIGVGTYLRAFHLARHLAALGHEVTLLATSKKARLRVTTREENGVRVVVFPDLLAGRLRNGLCPWNTLRRIVFLRNEKFDLVHAFDTRPVVIFPALYYKHKHKVPLVMDWADWWGRGGTIQERSGRLYSLIFGRGETFFEEYFRRFADGATTISLVLRKRLAEMGYPPEKIFLLRNGTDLPSAAAPDRESCRRALGLAADRPLIGHLGTLFEKDARLLFDSMRLLRKKREDLRLVLIGRHRLKLQRYNGQRRFLIETGEIGRETLPLWLSACDLLVLPLKRSIANQGRWPSKINDYFASGRPVVSTPVGDIGTIFERERIGLLAEDRPEEFAHALDDLFQDPERQSCLGQRALAFVRDHLDWRLIARGVEKFYNEIVLKTSPGRKAGVGCNQAEDGG